MQRDYRLTRDAQFRQVRARGRSYPHSLLVLYALPNGLDRPRFGFSVSKRIGGAVVRNRVKRRLREAARYQRPFLESGWDLVFIARAPIAQAPYQQVAAAVEHLLRRAGLRREPAPTANHQPPTAGLPPEHPPPTGAGQPPAASRRPPTATRSEIAPANPPASTPERPHPPASA